MNNELFITLVPKVYNNVFLFVGLTNLGTLLNFDWLIHQVECLNVSTTNFNLQKGKFARKIGHLVGISLSRAKGVYTLLT